MPKRRLSVATAGYSPTAWPRRYRIWVVSFCLEMTHRAGLVYFTLAICIYGPRTTHPIRPATATLRRCCRTVSRLALVLSPKMRVPSFGECAREPMLTVCSLALPRVVSRHQRVPHPCVVDVSIMFPLFPHKSFLSPWRLALKCVFTRFLGRLVVDSSNRHLLMVDHMRSSRLLPMPFSCLHVWFHPVHCNIWPTLLISYTPSLSAMPCPSGTHVCLRVVNPSQEHFVHSVMQRH